VRPLVVQLSRMSRHVFMATSVTFHIYQDFAPSARGQLRHTPHASQRLQEPQRHSERLRYDILGNLLQPVIVRRSLTRMRQVSFPGGGQARELLIRDLQRDVDFLESANIMDYSLFIAFQ
jgi:hypothetical protein